MRALVLGCLAASAVVVHCIGEEKRTMDALPAMEQVLDFIPCHSPGIGQKRLKMLSPFFRLVNVRDVTTGFSGGCIFERKHPDQQWGAAFDQRPKYKENEAYFWLVAHVLYWWCNIANRVAPAEQVKFMLKQDGVLQYRWVEVVVNAKLDASRALALECLRAGLWSNCVSGSFYDYTEWWGEPARLVDPAECASWPESSRDVLLRLAAIYSKDTVFKDRVVRLLSKDPSRFIRDSVARLIKSGDLPEQNAPPVGGKR